MKSILFLILLASSQVLIAQDVFLPAGFGEEANTETTTSSERPFFTHSGGYVELRAGVRTQSDPLQDDESLKEARGQLALDKEIGLFQFSTKTDFLYDGVYDDDDIDLNKGTGPIDLREASVAFSPSEYLDIKAGRQTLTWGTGNQLFINDLFPKDWQSFFSGRDMEYLKAPSDAVKASLFTELFNVDLVYTPEFDPDRSINGTRNSYYNPMTGTPSGKTNPITPLERDEAFDEDEVAIRMYNNIGSLEVALYGYDGFWKGPEAQNSLGQYYHPRLQVYGGSIRTPFLSGIANAEYGYYNSKDDSSGSNPQIRNSEHRYLVGYEQELAKNLTGSLQYYEEVMSDFEEYKKNLPTGSKKKDKKRSMVTIGLTKQLMNQNLTLDLFSFYSPTDKDGHIRFRTSYKFTDRLKGEIGTNQFFGEQSNTFWGQFEKSSNVFVALRYSF